jgi:hypothetical protein
MYNIFCYRRHFVSGDVLLHGHGHGQGQGHGRGHGQFSPVKFLQIYYMYVVSNSF